MWKHPYINVVILFMMQRITNLDVETKNKDDNKANNHLNNLE